MERECFVRGKGVRCKWRLPRYTPPFQSDSPHTRLKAPPGLVPLLLDALHGTLVGPQLGRLVILVGFAPYKGVLDLAHVSLMQVF